MTGRLLTVLCGLALIALPSSAVDKAQIDAAVQKGADYLRVTVGAAAYIDSHGGGETALAGMALLAAGSPANDSAIEKIASRIRLAVPQERQTYNLALYILFLDKLAQPEDRSLIQLCGIRLYAGMNRTGGWGYTVPDGIGTNLTFGKLSTQVLPAPKPKQPEPDTGFPTVTKPASKEKPEDDPALGTLHPHLAQLFILLRQSILVNGRTTDRDDNSNTQFGLIGLYVASGHGLPVQDAFALIEQRFVLTQNRADGGWAYSDPGPSKATMTCAGLLGLAVGSARNAEATLKAESKPKTGDAADPFFSPPKPKEDDTPKNGDPTPNVGGSAQTKVAIAVAMKALGSVLNAPLEQVTESSYLFYFLWSVERVCVAYGIDTLGGVNWHDWGCQIILASGLQAASGAWTIGGSGDVIDTSFALLFLTKSNFTSGLSSKLTGKVNDPGKAELRGGGMDIASAPKGSTGESHEAPKPNMPEVKVGSPQDTIAKALVSARDGWDKELTKVRDTAGSDYTNALVQSIPLLTQARQKEARDALANRLTRMTPGTLRTMLRDESPELKRAAALACAMKDDASHVPDLIALIDDESDLVVAAVRAGLKSLTKQDFGPSFPATAADKSKAAQAWKAWQVKNAR